MHKADNTASYDTLCKVIGEQEEMISRQASIIQELSQLLSQYVEVDIAEFGICDAKEV